MVGPLTTWPSVAPSAAASQPAPPVPDGVGGKERGAQQSDAFLAQAQKLDAVNPEVRRAATSPVGRPDRSSPPAVEAAPGLNRMWHS